MVFISLLTELHFLFDGGWLIGKKSSCQAGDLVLVPGSGRVPGEVNGNPLQYSCWILGNPLDRGAWQAIVHGATKQSDMTEQLNNNSNIKL